jgi:hypothetical protein
MAKKQSKTGFWIVLSVVNLLMFAYPISMLYGADNQEANVVAVIALCGVGLVLGVADMISVLLAYSSSY